MIVLLITSMCVVISAHGQSPDSATFEQSEISQNTVISDDLNPQLDYLDVVPPIIENRKLHAYPWIFMVAVCILLLVGFIRAVAMSQHKVSLVVAFSNITNQFEQMDKEATINPIIFLQAIVSAIILALALFVFEPFPITIDIQHNFKFFLLLVLGICLVYTIKYFTHYLIGVVLQSEELAILMVVGLSGMLYAFTLLIFPLITVWYYVPSASIKGIISVLIIALSCIFVLWRLIKSIVLYYRHFPFAKIYIIIYLCALEITPLLIIGKLVGGVID